MPPRYGVAWRRLPCANRTATWCRDDSRRSTLAVTLSLLKPIGSEAAEVVVLEVAVGRIGQVRLQVARDRRDAAGRDDVAGERIADEAGAVRVGARRRRIVDDDRQRAEVAVALRRGRDRDQPRLGLPPIAIAVVGDEEERLVAAQRPAEREAELVLVVVRLGGGEERLAVEPLVAEELEGAAAEQVGARLDDVVRRALAVVHDGRAAGLDLELVDRLDRDAERQVAALRPAPPRW